ncbi:hypothetical protein [Nonomuraea indica]|nr:hypothetical protein [Nonomuraea indica]
MTPEPVQPPPLNRAEATPGDGDQDVSQDPDTVYESEVADDEQA